MRKGQTLPPKQRLKIELPKEFLGQFGGEVDAGIPRAKVLGAVAAGVGTYLLVRTIQKTAGNIVRTLAGGITTVANFFIGIFASAPAGGTIRPATPLSFDIPEEKLLALDPFAVAVGLITGGMVLAGLNPGEILRGIGEIIPG